MRLRDVPSLGDCPSGGGGQEIKAEDNAVLVG